MRGVGTFDDAVRNATELVRRGFDTRIICTVNRVNVGDSLRLLDIVDKVGVSLVKYHVFSVIGSGHDSASWAMQPSGWIEFYERLEKVAPGYRTRVWYQPPMPAAAGLRTTPPRATGAALAAPWTESE